MGLYNIDNINIISVIHVFSECKEGEFVNYTNYSNCYELIICLDEQATVKFHNSDFYEASGYIRFLPLRKEKITYIYHNIKSGAYIDIFFQTGSELPTEAFCKNYSANKNLPALFTKLYNTYQKKKTGYYNLCLSIFYEILSEIQKTDEQHPHMAHRNKLQPAVDHIHKYYCDPDLSYTQLAELCSVSYTYFKKLFISVYGVTPSDYVKRLRIQKACDLLLTMHFSISQIAEMCGYSNVYYFSRVFKAEIGTPPSEYMDI